MGKIKVVQFSNQFHTGFNADKRALDRLKKRIQYITVNK